MNTTSTTPMTPMKTYMAFSISSLWVKLAVYLYDAIRALLFLLFRCANGQPMAKPCSDAGISANNLDHVEPMSAFFDCATVAPDDDDTCHTEWVSPFFDWATVAPDDDDTCHTEWVSPFFDWATVAPDDDDACHTEWVSSFFDWATVAPHDIFYTEWVCEYDLNIHLYCCLLDTTFPPIPFHNSDDDTCHVEWVGRFFDWATVAPDDANADADDTCHMERATVATDDDYDDDNDDTHDMEWVSPFFDWATVAPGNDDDDTCHMECESPFFDRATVAPEDDDNEDDEEEPEASPSPMTKGVNKYILSECFLEAPPPSPVVEEGEKTDDCMYIHLWSMLPECDDQVCGKSFIKFCQSSGLLENGIALDQSQELTLSVSQNQNLYQTKLYKDFLSF